MNIITICVPMVLFVSLLTDMSAVYSQAPSTDDLMVHVARYPQPEGTVYS